MTARAEMLRTEPETEAQQARATSGLDIQIT